MKAAESHAYYAARLWLASLEHSYSHAARNTGTEVMTKPGIQQLAQRTGLTTAGDLAAHGQLQQPFHAGRSLNHPAPGDGSSL